MPLTIKKTANFSYITRATSVEREPSSLDIMEAINNLTKLPASPERDVQIAKIQSLRALNIPTGATMERFYSFSDKAGGVTEKTCLIDEDTLIKRLRGLTEAKTTEALKQCEIKPTAILKHPKRGSDIEVQRESIGLSIAKILGFQVTENIIVNHDTGSGKHPCLFVRFDNMQELGNYMKNQESSEGRLQTIHHKEIEDFGKYAAYFMMCSDTDGIGKAGQNKGILDKCLYIFDQVFNPQNNLGLDRAFNLYPTNPLSKLTDSIARHFMGRNKSVINDSSFEEKIQGAINILNKKQELDQLFEAAKTANADSKNPIANTLRQDAEKCQKSYAERIKTIERQFPSVTVKGRLTPINEIINNPDRLNLLKRSMLITQLVNKAKIYDEQGEPYRVPFFSNPATYINAVSIQDEKITVSFTRNMGPPLSSRKKAILEENGFTLSADGKSASILVNQLNLLQDKKYNAEQEKTIDLDHNYIDPKKIERLGAVYKENIVKVLILVSEVNKSKDKNIALQKALTQIESFPKTGFSSHVKQCFLYEAMKEQIIKSPSNKSQLVKDFQKAKLDGSLEKYVKEQIKQNPETKFSAHEINHLRAAMNDFRFARDEAKKLDATDTQVAADQKNLGM